MKRIFVPISLVFVLLPFSVSAATYYVDATDGNDSYDGLYQTYSPPDHGPWQNISRVNEESFSPGDTIYFERGEEWRETLNIDWSGNSTNPITFGAYGSGAKPIINGADLVTDWEESETNVWNASLTIEPRQVFFNRTRGIIANLSELDSANEWNWSNNVLYVYSTSDPDTAYTSPGIEAIKRHLCITSYNEDYIDITGLDIRNANFSINVDTSSNYWNIYNNSISYAAKRGIYSPQSDYLNIFNNNFSYCGIHMDTAEHAIYLSRSDNVEVYGNEISHSWDCGIKVDSCNGVKVYNNYIHDNVVSNTYFAEILVTGTADDCLNVEIYYNIIKIGDGYAIQAWPESYTISNVDIYNNAIWDNNPGPLQKTYVLRLEQVDGLNITNNAIQTGRQYIMYYDDNTDVSRDYNSYYGWTHATNIGYVEDGFKTWATVSATETNSINADPLFTNASGYMNTSTDFQLQSNSPCIDNGTDVGLTQDYEGNSVPQGSAPDIGAYESTPTLTVTLESPSNGTSTSNTTIIFNCSATDDLNLANITLYGNWSGGWHANETKNLTGTSNSTTFTKNLTEGSYIWNCLAYDNDSNSDWGNSNYTLTIDTTAPMLYLESPSNNTINTTDNTPDFTFNVSDNLASTLDCTLWLNSTTPTAYGNNASVLNATSTTITANSSLSNDDYWWWINCSDGANTNISEKRNISISIDTAPIITVVSPLNQTYNTTTIDFNVSLNENTDWCGFSLDGVESENTTWTAENQTGDETPSDYSSSAENWRTIIDNTSINTSGTKIRIKFAARSDLTTYINGSSIGLRNGSTDQFDVAPTRITWDGGSNSTTISAGNTKWSDWMDFDLDETKDHLVHMWTETTNDHRGLQWNEGGAQNSYADSNNSDLTLTLDINGTVVTYLIGLEEIEVKSATGTGNVTMTKFNDTYFNYTNSSMTQGQHNVTFSCNDTSGNMNASAGLTYFTVDSQGPSLSSEGSNETAINQDEYFCLNITATDTISGVDTVYAEVWNTTDWLNYTMSEDGTSCDGTPTDGVYGVEIQGSAEGLWNYSKTYANDTLNNWNSYDFADLTINVSVDTIAPIIYLESPANNTLNTTDATPDFVFNTTDETASKLDCTLWLNSTTPTAYGNNASVLNATSTTITANSNLANDDYWWWINCSDGANTNISEKRNISINVSGVNYYVNATTGNDSDNGLSPATAWKTISKVNSMSFNPGDTIYFERGEEWREELLIDWSGNSTNPITFGSYGSGAKPIITKRGSLSGWDNSSNWTEESEATTYFIAIWSNQSYKRANTGTSGDYYFWQWDSETYGETWPEPPTIGDNNQQDDFDAYLVVQGGNVGDDTPGVSGDYLANYIYFHKVIVETSGEVTSLKVYFNATDKPTSGNVKAAIYTMSGNSPNTIITNGETEEKAWADITGDEWTNFTFSTNPTVSIGAPDSWYTPCTQELRRLWLNGTEYLRAETQEDVNETSRFFLDSNNDRLYVYATSNPSSFYSNIEASWNGSNAYTIESTSSSYITIENLDLRGGYKTILLRGVNHWIIDNCDVGLDATKNAIDVLQSNGDASTYVEIKNCMIESGYNFAYDYEGAGVLDGIRFTSKVNNSKIYNNTISNWGHNCVILDAGTDVDNDITNNEIYDNIMEAPNVSYCRALSTQGISANSGGNKFYRNLIRNTTVRNQINGDNNEFYYNIFHSFRNSPIYAPEHDTGQAVVFEGSSGWNCTNNKVYNNVIYDTDGVGIRVWDNPVYTNKTGNEIINNIIIDTGKDSNIGDDNLSLYIGNVTVGANTYQNNLLYKSGITNVVEYQGVAMSVSTFNSNDGNDGDVIQNNIQSDPLFTNASNNNFTLQFNSPAIDAGTDVNLTRDYSNNSIYGAPDIGAHEYQPPYNMSIDGINVSSVRIYGDGKYRYLNNTDKSSNLTIYPLNGWSSYLLNETRPQWMDVAINEWNTSTDVYNWTENATGISNVTHILSGLSVSTDYNITVNSSNNYITGPECTGGICTTDSSGLLNFTYNGSYSEKEFIVTQSGGPFPTVTLNSPADNANLSSGSVTFNCTAYDNINLTNVTLYGNWSGGWHANETNSSPVNNTPVTFSKTISDGIYVWNCYACDNSSNCAFAAANRTFTIDATAPTITWEDPTPNNETTTTNTSIEINVSITESDLDEVKFNWNGTNYTIFNDSLILMMNFDNVSALGENDTYVVDVSWSGNNGTTSGNPIMNLTGGKFNGAFEFDGDDDYISVGNVDSLNFGTNDFTISSWINTIATGTQFIVFKRDGVCGSTEAGYGYSIEEATGDIYGYIGDGSNGGCYTFGNSYANDGQWHNIIFLADRTNDVVKIYIDGTQFGSNWDISSVTGSVNNTLNLDIGRWGSYNFNGTIDEVRIWNRSLSASEIQELYFTNLRKYDTDKWSLYVNQSKNSTSGLDVGSYTYQAFAQDNSNNLNQTETRYLTITTDNAPNVTLNSPINYYNSTSDSITFNCTAYDDINLTNVTLYGSWSGGWHLNETNSTPINNTPTLFSKTIDDGIYVWNCKACDNSSNCAFAAANRTFTVDSTAPLVYLESPSNNTINTTDNTPDFTFNVTDETASTLDCTLWLDNGTEVAYGNNASVLNATSTTITANSSLANDDYWWWINCSDGVNTNISEKRNISINYSAPPLINIISPLNQTYSISSIDFNISSNENLGFCKFTLNDWIINYTMTLNASLTGANYTNSSVNDGSYTAKFWCNDTNGNVNDTEQVGFSVDTTAPLIYLESPSNNTINTTDNTPDFTFNVTDETASTLDCTLWLNSTTPTAYGNNASVLNATSTTITANSNLANDDYWWWINCSDGVNTNISEKRNISIDVETIIYYVDATTGNDSDTGLTEELAWKTISKVNSWDFDPGDSILFKRGEVWREMIDAWLTKDWSGTEGNPITFGAYGTGDRPEIIGSTALSSWTEESSNIWYASQSTDPDGLLFVNTDTSIVWGDAKADNSPGLLVNEYDWCWNSTNSKIYVYSTTDPGTAYNAVEAPTRSWAFRAYSQSYFNIENLVFKYAKQDGIRTNGEPGDNLDYVNITNCESKYNVHHGFKVSTDTLGERVQAQYVTYTNCTSHHNGFVGFQASDGTGDISFINCTSHDNGQNPVYNENWEGIGFRFGETLNGLIQNCQSYNNTYYGVRVAAWLPFCFNPENIIIEDSEIHDNGNIGILFICEPSYYFIDCIVRRNKIYGNGAQGIYVTNPFTGGEISYNLIYENVGGITYQPSYTGGNGEIYNNVVANNTGTGISVGSSVTVVGKNNIISNNSVQQSISSGTWDYNCWYPDWAGKGSNSINADPKFVDAGNANFHLQSNSPCIDNGTDVGLTLDYAGNTVPQGDGVDIGAYEYTPTNVTVTLNSPVDTYNSSSSSVTFNCSAADDINLTNITLYGNWSGWHANETKTVTGTSNSTTFSKTISDGIYIWNCLAYDNDSNSDWGNSNYTLTVDTTAPYFTALVNQSSYDNESLNYDINASDDGIGLDSFSIDDTANFSIVSSTGVITNITALVEHYYIVNVSINDTLGNLNWSLWSLNVTGAPDTTPPTIQVQSPTNTTYSTSTIWFNATADETIDTWIVNYNGTNVTHTINTTLTVEDGNHHLLLYANDSANNFGLNDTIYFTVDSTSPNATINAPANNTNTTDNTLDINITLTDNIASAINYTFYINDTANKTGVVANDTATNVTLDALAEGLYRIKVKATDNASNSANSSEIWVTIDSTAPVISHDSPANGTYFNYAPYFNGTCSDDNLDSIWTNLSEYDTIDNSSPYNFTNTSALTDGIYSVRISCNDSVNNTVTSDFYFTFDITNPTPNLVYPPNNTASTSGSITFTYNVSDTNSIENCSLILNGNINQTNSSITKDTNQTFSKSLTNAQYNWSVNCTDVANNIGASEVYNLSISDVTAPNITLISPSDSSTWTSSSTVTFSYNVSDDSDINNCSLLIDNEIDQNDTSITKNTTQTFSKSLSNANYNWSVNCFDFTGNQGNSSVYDLTVSYTAPDGNGGNGDGGSNGFVPPVITNGEGDQDSLLGDINDDGCVDIQDILLVVMNFGLTYGFDERADVNGDGEVDIVDLVLVALNFGEGSC